MTNETNLRAEGATQKMPTKKRDAIIALAAVAVLIAAVALAALLDGGKDPAPRSKRYQDWFAASLSVVTDYSGDGEEAFEQRLRIVEETLGYYHKLFDIYREYEGVTNLATVNRLAPTEAVKVDKELIDFLLFSKDIYYLTEGQTNVAFGAVLRLWHDARELGSLDPKNARLPDSAALTEAAKHCDIEKLIIDEEASTVRFGDPKMSLDVGAIGKGYATERAAEALIAAGADGVLLDIGGNLRLIGTKPSGKGVKTGITNPDLYSDEKYVYSLELKNCSAVTSGDYRQFYTVAGVKYHHIIDPDTLMPENRFSSVTVITPDSGLADGLSTALFNMTYEEGVAVLDKLVNVKAVWVKTSGEVVTYGF